VAAKNSRKPLMAGNWKMNLHHLEAIALVQKLSFTLTDADYERTEVAVLPPFTDLRSVQTMVDGDKLQIVYGAQDLSPHDNGAYTGDISGAMLSKLGCTYVVIGHSERRQYHAETDDVVNAKIRAAVRHGLVPILCVGEPLDIRREGSHAAHCTTQLDGALAGIPDDVVRTIVIAYEPVWAIGTGEVATPEDAQEVCAALRARLAELYPGDLADGVRILYGGSVKAANVAGIMEQPDVDGALVGGASLDATEFAGVCRFAP
jgi:triosephosphate isomerase